jgi:hypothetical protein
VLTGSDGDTGPRRDAQLYDAPARGRPQCCHAATAVRAVLLARWHIPDDQIAHDPAPERRDKPNTNTPNRSRFAFASLAPSRLNTNVAARSTPTTQRSD